MIIVLDGREGRDGRALLLISALHHCAAELQGFELWIADAAEPGVLVAISLLRWDLGLDVRPLGECGDAVLASAGLFASISCGLGPWYTLSRIQELGVATLLARQFPPRDSLSSEHLSMIRAAHDPEVFARRLVTQVRALA